MTDGQKAELARDRDRALIREALQAGRRAKIAGREEDRDLLHRLIARIAELRRIAGVEEEG